MVIPALEQRHQVIVGLACGTFILHVTHSGQEGPVGLRGGITVVKAIECPNKSIFPMEVAQVLLKYRIVLIKEVEAAGSGHTRRSAHQNCIGPSNFVYQDLHILAVDDALHILAFLSMGAGQRITSAKIAESVKTNPAYIRQLMAALKSAGMITSSQGQAKAELTRQPGEITVLDVYRAIEGNKPLLHWDIDTNPECGVGIYVQLSIADFYQEIQKAAEQKMQAITLQDIIDRYGKKLDELEQKSE